MKTKTCFKCGKTKPLTDFYHHPRMADGHFNKCKECAKEDARTYKRDNARQVLQSRIATCEKEPNAMRAHRAIDAAITAGAIRRPTNCSGCGCSDTEHRIEAHHYDYSKPLDVIWLCTPCHRRMDAQRRKREGKKPYARSRA